MENHSNNRRTKSTVAAVTAAVILAGADPAPALPEVHVTWVQPGLPPEADSDYVIDTNPPASPEFPNVQLFTGSLGWRIWSRDGSDPDGLGNIGTISVEPGHPEDFVVALRDPDDPFVPGARDVKGIHLLPSGPGSQNHYSGISAGTIRGSLLEGLDLQATAAGLGGDCRLYVEGPVGGQVRIPTAVDVVFLSGGTADVSVGYAGYLLFAGDAAGTLTVETALSVQLPAGVSGTLSIGEIPVTGNVTIGDGTIGCGTLAPGIAPHAEAPVRGAVGPIEVGTIHPLGLLNIQDDLTTSLTVTDRIEGGTLAVEGRVLPSAVVTIADIFGYGELPGRALFGFSDTIHQDYCSFYGQLSLKAGIGPQGLVRLYGTLEPGSAGSGIDLNGQDIAGTLRLRGGDGLVSKGGAVRSGGGANLSDSPYSGFSGRAGFEQVDSGGSVHGGNLLSTGDLSISGPVSGLLTFDNLDGRVEIAGSVEGGKVEVRGDLTGSVRMRQLNGGASVNVRGNMTGGAIRVIEDADGDVNLLSGFLDGSLITVGGQYDGHISLDEGTGPGSLIHAMHLGPLGAITVNAAATNSLVEGDIIIGRAAPYTTCPYPPVTFAGCVTILSGPQVTYPLVGEVTVRGCHPLGTPPLNICTHAPFDPGAPPEAPEPNVFIDECGCFDPVALDATCQAPCP